MSDELCFTLWRASGYLTYNSTTALLSFLPIIAYLYFGIHMHRPKRDWVRMFRVIVWLLIPWAVVRIVQTAWTVFCYAP